MKPICGIIVAGRKDKQGKEGKVREKKNFFLVFGNFHCLLARTKHAFSFFVYDPFSFFTPPCFEVDISYICTNGLFHALVGFFSFQ